MDYIQQEPQKSRKRILRPSISSNSLNLLNGSRISKISSQIGDRFKTDSKNARSSVYFKQNQITQQLQREIVAIENCIQQYKPFVQHIKENQKQKTIRQQIFWIDDILRSKDEEIKSINQQVKYLKNLNNPSSTNKNNKNNSSQQQISYSWQQTNKKSNQNLQENNIFMLAEELKQQRQFLEKLQNQHSAKQYKLKQISSMVQEIQQTYVEKCLKTRQRPLRYEEFKQLNEEKKRQLEIKARKGTQQTTVRQKNSSNNSSLKEMPAFVFSTEPIKIQRDPNTANTKKSLKSLQNRKTIAQQALKNARKKHNNQLNQLMAKLQFLRDQDTLLFQKIREKEEQRAMLESKFNQQKGTGSFNFQRLMSPKSKSKENNSLNRFQGADRGAKFNGIMSPMSPTSPRSNPKTPQPHQHPFSPHRRLISSRKATQHHQTQRAARQVRRKLNTMKERESNESRVPFYDCEMGRFDDYEERTFNPNSKSGDNNPSTNEE